MAGLLLKNIPTADQKEEARRLIRRAIEGFAKWRLITRTISIAAPNALEGYILAIKSCVAVPGSPKKSTNSIAGWKRRCRNWPLTFPIPATVNGGCLLSTTSGWGGDGLHHLSTVAERVYRELIEIFKTFRFPIRNSLRSGCILPEHMSFLGDIQWRLGKRRTPKRPFVERWKSMTSTRRKSPPTRLPEIALDIASDYLHAALFLAATHRDDEAAEFVRKAAL